MQRNGRNGEKRLGGRFEFADAKFGILNCCSFIKSLRLQTSFMGPLQAIERKKAKGKGRGGRGKGRLLLGRGKGKGKGCRKGRGRAAQSENSALRRRLSFNGVDSNQASPMGSQQVHQGDSAAPATPKIDNDDATMEIDPPNVEPVPSSAVSDAAAAASDDVSVEPTVVCCSQLGSLDLFTAESEPADDVVPAVAKNESGEASEDPTAGDVMPQAAALAPEPEPDAPSETPAEAASSARGPNVHRTPDELHLITPPSCSIHLNCNLALTKTDLD